MGCRALPPPVVVSRDIRPLPKERRMIRHAFQEARREVASWLSGEIYCWKPFVDQPDPLDNIEPIDCLRLLR